MENSTIILLLQIWLISSAALAAAAGIGFYFGMERDNENTKFNEPEKQNN